MNHCFPFIRPANEFKRGGVRWGGGRLRLTGCLVMGGMVIFIMRMTLAPPRCPCVCVTDVGLSLPSDMDVKAANDGGFMWFMI